MFYTGVLQNIKTSRWYIEIWLGLIEDYENIITD